MSLNLDDVVNAVTKTDEYLCDDVTSWLRREIHGEPHPTYVQVAIPGDLQGDQLDTELVADLVTSYLGVDSKDFYSWLNHERLHNTYNL